VGRTCRRSEQWSNTLGDAMMSNDNNEFQFKLLEHFFPDGSSIICSPEVLNEMIEDIQIEMAESRRTGQSGGAGASHAHTRGSHLRLVVDNTIQTSSDNIPTLTLT